ncbi:AmmeMemoRadiSam system radical SAM enzyme [uncultured Mobiluncus sp.]|uniref:AmmeMemoRadiSam system radical SAM enzyme n=1 Tax=uncultured Mobiluncus sp. TaxID=293425 RepID=UPI00288B5DC1|nr:AmmeMemoRadiSam system radical SAM enzyme [uncultured Mobiluncus sp.]
MGDGFETTDMKSRDRVAKWWTLREDGRIRCDLCPRACTLRDGQRGFCYTRMAQGQKMVLDTYGRCSGLGLDPIEKKPLYHFLPGSQVLSFGTAGCNLNCQFCQNWDISKARENDRLTTAVSPGEIADLAVHYGAQSVAFTYNDPTIFAEYAIDTARACHTEKLRTVAVSAGYICAEPRREMYAEMDAANLDLKGFTDDFYWHLTGAHLRDVLETIAYVCNETECWVELTTLLIPGHNDSDTEIRNLAKWIVENVGPDVPLHFSAFHPDWKMRDVPRTPAKTLQRAREIAQGEGIRFVYIGNVRDREGGSTFCPGCGASLIVRDWFNVCENTVGESGQCPRCATVIPGVWT